MDEEDVIWSLDHAASAVASAGPAAPGGSQGSLPVKDETTSGVATLTSTASSNLFADLDQDTSGKFQGPQCTQQSFTTESLSKSHIS